MKFLCALAISCFIFVLVMKPVEATGGCPDEAKCDAKCRSMGYSFLGGTCAGPANMYCKCSSSFVNLPVCPSWNRCCERGAPGCGCRQGCCRLGEPGCGGCSPGYLARQECGCGQRGEPGRDGCDGQPGRH